MLSLDFYIDSIFNMAYPLNIIHMNHISTLYQISVSGYGMVSTHNCSTQATSGSPEHSIAEYHSRVVK